MKTAETLQEKNRRLLAEAIREYERDSGRASNRGNQIIDTPDGQFHSQGEYKRWCELKIEQRARVITELKRQVPYAVEINGIHICYWIADFEYVRAGERVREDYKKYQEPIFRLKRKLIEALYGWKISLSGEPAAGKGFNRWNRRPAKPKR